MKKHNDQKIEASPIRHVMERIIFSSKYLLIPFYMGLFIVLLAYLKVYCLELYEMVFHIKLSSENILLMSLEMVDVVMIANLIKMIITGSYTSFVNKDHSIKGERPASSGILKVKMATSLIGVSSIHLLKTFIECSVHTKDWNTLWQQVVIHVSFLIGAFILAWIEYIHVKGEALELKTEHETGHEMVSGHKQDKH